VSKNWAMAMLPGGDKNDRIGGAVQSGAEIAPAIMAMTSFGLQEI
jgi:hypothetical protein